MRIASFQSPAAAPVAAPPSNRSRPAPLLTLAAMSLGYGVVQLDLTIVNIALHAIGSSLGGGVAELQWVVSTPLPSRPSSSPPARLVTASAHDKSLWRALRFSPRHRSPARWRLTPRS